MSNAAITKEEMRNVYEEMKTPVKHGLVLFEEGVNIDCQSIPEKRRNVCHGICRQDPNDEKPGYETLLAESKDLLHWKTVGKLLEQTESGMGLHAEGRERMPAGC